MSEGKSEFSILAIDDSDEILTLLEILLVAAGYRFSSANNANDAFKLITKRTFDLILMDIEMPDTTGIELLILLKDKNLIPTSKIIMLTGKTDSEFISQSIDLGADGYILKPFKQENIINRIEAIL